MCLCGSAGGVHPFFFARAERRFSYDITRFVDLGIVLWLSP